MSFASGADMFYGIGLLGNHPRRAQSSLSRAIHDGSNTCHAAVVELRLDGSSIRGNRKTGSDPYGCRVFKLESLAYLLANSPAPPRGASNSEAVSAPFPKFTKFVQVGFDRVNEESRTGIRPTSYKTLFVYARYRMSVPVAYASPRPLTLSPMFCTLSLMVLRSSAPLDGASSRPAATPTPMPAAKLTTFRRVFPSFG